MFNLIKYITYEVIYIDLRAFTVILLAVLVLIPLLLPLLKKIFLKIWEPRNIHRKAKNNRPLIMRKYTPYNPIEFQKVLPNFNVLTFQNQTLNIYIKVQNAIVNFDYDTLKKYVTDETYNMYKKQLEIIRRKKRQIIIKDISLKYFDIVGMEIKPNFVALTVFMKINCIKYTINHKGKIISGSSKKRTIQNNRLTFVKGLDKTPNRCPNCNAPVQNLHTVTCEYCNSIITTDTYDWTLSERQITSQEYKNKKNIDELILSHMKNKNI